MTLRLGNKKVCPTKLVKVNNVDWNKVGYAFGDYRTDFNYGKILSGKVYAERGVYPRATADETGTTKFVNFSQPFEINIEFTAPTVTSHNHVLFGNGYTNQYFRSPACEYQANTSNVTFWAGLSTSGSTWNYGLVFTPDEIPKIAGDTYNVNYKYDGSRFILSITHNDITLTKSVEVVGTPYYSTDDNSDGTYFSFGENAGNSGTAFEGYFHAWNTYIKQNNILVWGCENNQSYPDRELTTIYLYPNYTKTGTIIDNVGVVKTYGASEYLTSTVATPASGTYEINVNFTTPENAITGDSPLIEVNNGDVYVNRNMKLSSWTGSTGRGGITILSTNTNYSFKLVRGNSDTTVYLKTGLPSDSLSDYTQEYTITNYSDSSNIIFLKYGTIQYWPGTIDMKYCNMKKNGTILWEGCTKTIIS